MSTYPQIIGAAERKFNEITEVSPLVDWEKESMFALQAVASNDYLKTISEKHPDSLRNAVINVAAVGLSLNPATHYAYLVPRDGAACLDISYQGLIKLATDTGSIKWARADLVYELDKFEYHGPAEKPAHTANPFGDRGAFHGVYCIAKTHDGDYLTEVMSAEQIEQVKKTSPSAVKGKGPWVQWFGEMAKKTVIKRASKTWPKSDQGSRLQDAIDLTNIADGVTVEPDDYVELLLSDEQIANIEALIEEVGADLEKLLKFKHVEKMDQIPAKEYDSLVHLLEAKRAA